jgi:predicted AlkP superfamily phosphohydrolase/phosphomutase
MDGGLCINEVLLRVGWLTLVEDLPSAPKSLENVSIGWSKTRAWGEGGYYGRVFMNVAGREPRGIVPAEDYEQVRDELAALLQGVRGPEGEVLDNAIYKPQSIYRQVHGIAPDLIVYWDNLHWRSVGSIGHGSPWTRENDTGPDDANHAQDGVFIFSDPACDWGGKQLSGLSIMDFAPTVLRHFGLSAPADMQGQVITAER